MLPRFLLLLLVVQNVAAELSTEEALEGFDDESAVSQGASANPPSSSLHQMIWRAGYFVAVNYTQPPPLAGQVDRRGLAKSQFRTDLDWRWKTQDNVQALRFSMHGFYDTSFDEYSAAVRDVYEREWEIDEAYYRFRPHKAMDVTVGNQVVVWGRSDNFRLLDVVNPLNNREPGMTDIKDLRLPVFLLRTDLYRDAWHWQFLLIPEIAFDRNPIFGSDYYPFSVPPEDDEKPKDWRHLEMGFALNKQLRNGEISVNAARFFSDRGYVNGLRTRHEKINLAGISTSWAIQDYLFKGELAWLDGLRFSASARRFNRVDIMLGLEFAGLPDTQVVVELVRRHIPDYDSVLLTAPDITPAKEYFFSFRAVRNLFHDRLDLMLLWIAQGKRLEQGGVLRVGGEYEIKESLKLSLGWVDYLKGDSPLFTAMQDNDRIFFEIRYSGGL